MGNQTALFTYTQTGSHDVERSRLYSGPYLRDRHRKGRTVPGKDGALISHLTVIIRVIVESLTEPLSSHYPSHCRVIIRVIN